MVEILTLIKAVDKPVGYYYYVAKALKHANVDIECLCRIVKAVIQIQEMYKERLMPFEGENLYYAFLTKYCGHGNSKPDMGEYQVAGVATVSASQ
ncbi:MAG: hypothetical protein F9Y92_05675 [Thermoplasmatales archaeon]|jgi:hypothetical protein|nr:hypothetical protein [Thermoplasmatales archaeon]